MTVVGEMRVLPENIDASAERLRPIFERLSRI
jgi:F420-0:gamma-glutamyl ligase